MPLEATHSRSFTPGTTGWTLDDLRDPALRRLWDEGRYEIIEGVLTLMPAATFGHGSPLMQLAFVLKNYSHAHNLAWRFAPEVDVAAAKDRVLRADVIVMTPADLARQKALGSWDDDADDVGIVLVPPTLVVESLSKGHERHDRVTKRKLYAEFGVPNYWLLDRRAKTLECLVLDAGNYRHDVSGRGSDVLRPSPFPSLDIPLEDLWT